MVGTVLSRVLVLWHLLPCDGAGLLHGSCYLLRTLRHDPRRANSLGNEHRMPPLRHSRQLKGCVCRPAMLAHGTPSSSPHCRLRTVFEDLVLHSAGTERAIEPEPSEGSSRTQQQRVRATVREPCPKCKHPELQYYTMQLRSADEGQTVFYECAKCGHTFSTNT